MAFYTYKVLKEGKTIVGELEGKNKKEVASALNLQGFEIISISQQSLLNLKSISEVNIGGIPTKEKTIFLRQLAYMIQAGLPITQALENLSAQVKNIQFKKVIKKVSKDIQEGAPLSKAMAKHEKVFDKVIINLVKAGEESGKLDQILDRLAFDYEKKMEFNGKVKGALIYPAVILCVVIGVVSLIMIVMVPSIKGLYSDFGGKKKELPFITTMMIAISDFMVNYWWIIIIFLIAAIGAFNYYRKTPGGKLTLDALMIKIPIFGNIVRLSSISAFARDLSMLMSSGVPIIKSMELVSESLPNQLFANETANAAKRLEKGVILSQSISKDSPFTPMVFQMLGIGEQTGKTDVTLGKLADYYEREVDQITSNLTRILEPIILVLMAGIILVIALAVYLPVYSLGN